jgi:hypothetical protein
MGVGNWLEIWNLARYSGSVYHWTTGWVEEEVVLQEAGHYSANWTTALGTTVSEPVNLRSFDVGVRR